MSADDIDPIDWLERLIDNANLVHDHVVTYTDIGSTPIPIDIAPSVTYDDVLRKIAELPRIPRLNFRCHKDVVDDLKRITVDAITFAHPTLFGMPVITDPTYPPGAWKIFRDDKVVAEGTIIYRIEDLRDHEQRGD